MLQPYSSYLSISIDLLHQMKKLIQFTVTYGKHLMVLYGTGLDTILTTVHVSVYNHLSSTLPVICATRQHTGSFALLNIHQWSTICHHFPSIWICRWYKVLYREILSMLDIKLLQKDLTELSVWLVCWQFAFIQPSQVFVYELSS